MQPERSHCQPHSSALRHRQPSLMSPASVASPVLDASWLLPLCGRGEVAVSASGVLTFHKKQSTPLLACPLGKG